MKKPYKGTRAEDNIKELGDDFFKSAVRAGRPKSEHPKKPISFRFDATIVEHLKNDVAGYNARVESMLRQAMEEGRL